MDGEPPLRGGIEHVRKPQIDIRATTIPSEGHPDRNEDAIFQIPERRLLGVFDGMGGHEGGDRASRLARDRVARSLGSLSEGISQQQAQDTVRNALVDANQAVFGQASTEGTDMGTTAVVAYIWEGQGERKAIIGSVGDSRAYIYRGGKLEQVTLDDNMVKIMVTGDEKKQRDIQTRLNNIVNPDDLSPYERNLYDSRNKITQAIGSKNITPNIYAVALQPGDRLLLTSDGISDNLTDHEIADIVSKSSNGQVAVEQLTTSARQRSRELSHPRHKQDDMSAIVAEIPVTPSQTAPKQTISQEGHGLAKGQMVRVQRSNGDIEEGWKIDGFNSKTGDAIVTKIEQGQILIKEIPQKELGTSNRPKQEVDLSGAQGFGELFQTLDALGPIQGSSTTYETAELKKLINRVRSGNISIDAITRAKGLRQKVADLLEVEKIRRNLR